MIPKGQYLDVQENFRFHFYDEGEGEVVVLLHGSGTGASGHTNFKNNFSALKAAGFRVILPDLPGYGFSSKPEDVIYSINHHRGENSKSAVKKIAAPIKDIKADGKDRVIFTLDAGNADFPFMLSDVHFTIVPSGTTGRLSSERKARTEISCVN